VYAHAAEEILNGCICGSKLFYFVKNLKKSNKKKTCEDVKYFYEMKDTTEDELTEFIVFDIEAINVVSSGKYELNIDSLMNNNGLIYKYGDGKYSIDIDTHLKKLNTSKFRKNDLIK
jgi:predicted  nucleic acid-binding Zn-ribbon protein